MCLYLVKSRKTTRSIYLKIHTKLAYTIYPDIAYVYFRSDFVLRFQMKNYDVITTQSLKSRKFLIKYIIIVSRIGYSRKLIIFKKTFI